MKTSVKTNYVKTKSREKLKSTHKHSKQVLQISQNHLNKKNYLSSKNLIFLSQKTQKKTEAAA